MTSENFTPSSTSTCKRLPKFAKLLAAYDEYIKALAGVAAIDYGDISQERIDALVQAGSNMEPLIP